MILEFIKKPDTKDILFTVFHFIILQNRGQYTDYHRDQIWNTHIQMKVYRLKIRE